MSRINTLKQIYDVVTAKITSSREEWKDFLNFAAGIYKYNFDNTVLIYAQRPDATAVADMPTWNRKVGRYINKGAKSIAAFDTSEPVLKLKYLFDIKDTNGTDDTIPRLWKLTEKTASLLTAKLAEKYYYPGEDTLFDYINYMAQMSAEEAFDDYTQDIENDIKGTVLEDLPFDGVINCFQETIIQSIKYLVGTRCGIKLYDGCTFDLIQHYNSKALTFRLGNAVCGLSKNIINELRNTLTEAMNEQRSENHERSSKHQLHGEGRDYDSGNSNIKRQDGGRETPRQIWTDGAELSQGQPSEPVQLSFIGGYTAPNDAQGERGGLQQAGYNHGADVEDRAGMHGEQRSETQRPANSESRQYNRGIQTQRDDQDDSRRNHPPRADIYNEIADKNIENQEPKPNGSFFSPKNQEDDHLYNFEEDEVLPEPHASWDIPIEAYDYHTESDEQDMEDTGEYKSVPVPTHKPVNYRYSQKDEVGVGGQKTKYHANIDAIKTLKVIEGENRMASGDEQSILAFFIK